MLARLRLSSMRHEYNNFVTPAILIVKLGYKLPEEDCYSKKLLCRVKMADIIEGIVSLLGEVSGSSRAYECLLAVVILVAG